MDGILGIHRLSDNEAYILVNNLVFQQMEEDNERDLQSQFSQNTRAKQGADSYKQKYQIGRFSQGRAG